MIARNSFNSHLKNHSLNSIMAILSSTTIRTALVDYRAELIRMQIKYPQVYKENSAIIKSVDDALLSIEGNVEHVMISAHSCKS